MRIFGKNLRAIDNAELRKQEARLRLRAARKVAKAIAAYNRHVARTCHARPNDYARRFDAVGVRSFRAVVQLSPDGDTNPDDEVVEYDERNQIDSFEYWILGQTEELGPDEDPYAGWEEKMQRDAWED